MTLKVFVSYAKEDLEQALQCFERLVDAGVTPWLDVKKLLPGQNWEAEIERAFSDANVIVILLSKCSVDKRGFFQREANEAIEKLRYKKPTDIYVIPLLLEACDVPSYIANRLQYVNLGANDAWDQIRSSLKLAAEQQSIVLAKGHALGPYHVFTEKLEEKWQGAPGHDISIEYPRFEWFARPKIADELSQIFSGRAYKTLVQSRQNPLDQQPDLFPEIDQSRAANGRWESFGLVHATEELLSLAYEVSWYGAGAAHPNSHFETFNFFCNDRLHLLRLNDFFNNPFEAAKKLSALCISQLARDYWARVGECPDEKQMRWFENGAGPDIDNFASFTVSEDRFTFLFAPYEVAAYVFGRWSVDVSFYDLLDHLKADGPHLLATSSN